MPRNFLLRGLCILALACGSCAAQWELGGFGGFATTVGSSVTNAAGVSADSGFKSSWVGGAVFGNDSNDHWGGEVRYFYRAGDAKLSSGSTEATFAANQQFVSFDLLYHFQKRSAHPKARFFIAGGGGGRFIDGTGQGTAVQPLSDIAILTQGRETLGVVDFGAGVKVRMGKHTQFRVEVHDYMSPASTKVIAPVPGAHTSGWMQDIVPSAGISYTF